MKEENALLEDGRKEQEFYISNSEHEVGREMEVRTSEMDNTEGMVQERENGIGKLVEKFQDMAEVSENNHMEIEAKTTKHQVENRKDKKGIGKKRGKKDVEDSEETGKCQACSRTTKAHPKGRRKWIGCNRCGRWYIEECMFKVEEKIQRAIMAVSILL